MEKASIQRRRVSVFDFDGTLIKGDSFVLFALKSRGLLRFIAAIIRCLPSLIKWKLGLADGTYAKKALFRALYRGMSSEQFNVKCVEFASDIEKRLRPEIYQAFVECLSRGDAVYIITASIPAWIEPWANNHPGNLTVIGTESEIEGSKLTGLWSTPNCKGAEKLRRLAVVEPELNECYLTVFTDNKSDAELLKMASEGWYVRRSGGRRCTCPGRCRS